MMLFTWNVIVLHFYKWRLFYGEDEFLDSVFEELVVFDSGFFSLFHSSLLGEEASLIEFLRFDH